MIDKVKQKASRDRRSSYDLNKVKKKHPWEDGFYCGIDKQVRKDLQKAAKDANERIDNIAKTVEKLEKHIRELEQVIPLAKDMTLRDYYVGQMLLGWVKEDVISCDDPEKDGKILYKYVDDFMKARFIKIKKRRQDELL
jgi:hypothetical protein